MSQHSDFTELCIAVAQLAHSCQKLGLTSIKLQMNPADYQSLRRHALVRATDDTYELSSPLLDHNDCKLATIPVIVRW